MALCISRTTPHCAASEPSVRQSNSLNLICTIRVSESFIAEMKYGPLNCRTERSDGHNTSPGSTGWRGYIF
ncbi:hypothetical protein RHMOL_Rhmol01G0138600 [Rhododendron molle]|uniref:Uncharacterized protein n=1 Tax=Rhododendron molle TaxID=49168 RepID=A0ACC0Q2M1_RHOML|nr:hypothetical protein RHMOL_Rhmol01G0138600 [Rhododendron molle]